MPPNLTNVNVPANGTWTYPTKSGYLVNPGTYKAVVRGRVAVITAAASVEPFVVVLGHLRDDRVHAVHLLDDRGPGVGMDVALVAPCASGLGRVLERRIRQADLADVVQVRGKAQHPQVQPLARL